MHRRGAMAPSSGGCLVIATGKGQVSVIKFLKKIKRKERKKDKKKKVMAGVE